MAGQELLGILIAVVVIWFVLKLAKVAIKMIIFIIALVIIIGVVYTFFMR